jgi:saccharopine dehydrogenase-like NADP-dependent oxidoreductase
MADRDVVVIGASGAQAQAMFTASARGNIIGNWLALDRAWSEESRDTLTSLGVELGEVDVLADPDGLRDAIAGSKLVANFAGPYYRTGGAVLDACIAAGADYLDICDDADATAQLLKLDQRARDAGIRALIGMGSSPGVTNVLVRLGVDALGSADAVDIAWMTDVAETKGAALAHFWHIFATVDRDGGTGRVPAWNALERRRIAFPDPLGERLVLRLAHPEPLTLPRFVPVQEVTNWGGVSSEDALVTNWALARLGAGTDALLTVDGVEHKVADVALALFRNHMTEEEPAPYLGSGLVIDIRAGDDGFRFSSGDSLTMEESTGTPAAAGIALMLSDSATPDSGVFAPECLVPGEFFSTLGRVSRSTGSLLVHRLKRGAVGERVRIRDLAAAALQRR